MQWLALMTAAGAPAMKVGEEVMFACHAAHNTALRCVLMGRLKATVRGQEAPPPFGPRLFIQSTWDGKAVDAALVPYAFARPNPPEPKS